MLGPVLRKEGDRSGTRMQSECSLSLFLSTGLTPSPVLFSASGLG